MLSNDINTGLIALVDKHYLHFLKTLLTSLRKTNHKITAFVCLININKGEKLENDLRLIYENISFSYLSKDFVSESERRAFCSNYRVMFIKEILNQPLNLLIYFDADSIIRKDLTLADINPASDIEILMRDSDDSRFKVATGAMIIKNNNQSKLFFKHWEKNIYPKLFKWFSDQITCYETIEELSNDVVVCQIDERLIDWKFINSSIVWAGKGNRKYKNILYRLETLKIRTKNNVLQNIINRIQECLY